MYIIMIRAIVEFYIKLSLMINETVGTANNNNAKEIKKRDPIQLYLLSNFLQRIV